MADDTYDVFVSYSRVDGRHAAEIDSVLRDKGLKTFFDRRNLAAGLPWVRALEQAIGVTKAAVVLIGPRGLGNTQQYERELAFVRQTRDPTFPIVPVILPETTSDPPFDFLRVLTWVDFSHVARVSDAPDILQQLLTAIRGGGGTATEGVREAICPYRGLDAFREEDSAFFFGRGSADDSESAIGQLVRKVREHPFVMVVGRSGSGKSSLVYAGLLPALRREHDRFWNVLSLRPGPTPLRALAAAFNPRAENEGAAEYATKITNEADELRTGDLELLSHMIREQLDQTEGKPNRLLLYIDQWEELYAQAPSSSDKERVAQHAADVNRFIDLLLTATRTAPVAVVGTVRADFYDPLIAHQEIKLLLATRQVLLGKMVRSELEQTIVEPARKVGLTFDPPNVVQRILDEAGEDEGMLPLLQYALKETWARRQRNRMTGDSYTRSGGVREAIRTTAERTFEALSPTDQKTARQLFLRLVTPGEGQEDTRARAAMPTEADQAKIIAQFTSPRTRLLVTGFDQAKRPTVEVAHEALIRTWPRLRGWIDANREKLRARSAILQAMAEWERNDRRDDMLLPSGFQLERARALLADPGDLSTDDIQEFVALSSANEKRRREAEITRKKALLAATSMMSVRFIAWYIPLLICLLLGLLALRLWDPLATQVLRNMAFDTYQRLDPQTDENTPVRVVDIDSESLARIGQWPWPRTKMSDMILALRQARVIGLTVLFSEPDRYSLEEFFKSLPPEQLEEIRKIFGTKMTNDQVLAEAMRKANNVVLSLFPSLQASTFDNRVTGIVITASEQGNVRNYVIRYPGVVTNLPILQSAGRTSGLLAVDRERDGVVRHAPLVYAIGNELVSAFPMEIVGFGTKTYRIHGTEGIEYLTPIPPTSRIPTDSYGRVTVRFKRYTQNHSIPAWKLLSGAVSESEIAGRIILIGSSLEFAPAVMTPIGMMSGVELFAQTIENILSDSMLVRPFYALSLEVLVAVLVTILLAVILPGRRPLGFICIVICTFLGISITSWYAFKVYGYLFDPTFPLMTLVALIVLIVFLMYFEFEQRRNVLRQSTSP